MTKKIFFIILALGLIYRIITTSNGNFLFNMDNARDALDVREMVVLHKPRLIGPTSGIAGIYTGPGWYYLLAIPFLISQGNPYASILLMILLWLIGGVFLFKIVEKYGTGAIVSVGAIWVSSNYLRLVNVYAFNPNPVVLLTPLLIFILDRYLRKGEVLFSLGVWFLSGLFFNFEMAAGLFLPLVILLAIFICNRALFKNMSFWYGVGAYLLTLLPQLLFYTKNKALLIISISNFFSDGANKYDIVARFGMIKDLYFGVLSATYMNLNTLALLIIVSTLILFLGYLKVMSREKRDFIIEVSLLLGIVPFLGSILLPLTFLSWHVGLSMSASIILFSIIIGKTEKFDKYIGITISLVILIFAIWNLEIPRMLTFPASKDPSTFVNEVNAIDYTYKLSQGKNFKIYTYLPSVYDYSYQYLFWWYGQRKYGYLPEDYSYLPNKPPYISSKEKFSNKVTPPDSGLTFLVMEPDVMWRKQLWQNNFTSLKILSSTKVGPIEVEVGR